MVSESARWQGGYPVGWSVGSLADSGLVVLTSLPSAISLLPSQYVHLTPLASLCSFLSALVSVLLCFFFNFFVSLSILFRRRMPSLLLPLA